MQRTLWLLPPSPYEPLLHPAPSYSLRWQDIRAGIMAFLIIYFCVSIILLRGYYGDSRIMLGPGSSRMVKASPVFVEQVEVRNLYNTDISLYAFTEKPELISQTNWATSKFLVIEAYSRKGIVLWLNKGSTIHMRWEAHASSINQLEGVVIKGQRTFEKLQPKTVSYKAIAPRKTVNGKQAEYIIEEDDSYLIGVLNMNARSTPLTMNVNILAKVYDTSKAKKMCCHVNESCRLGLLFPNTYYVILATPENVRVTNLLRGDDEGWHVEISFVARVLAYVALFGLFMIVCFLILKCLGACHGHHESTNVTTNAYVTNSVVDVQEITETQPIIHLKPNSRTYGTNEDHDEESDASSSSSEELYDEKLCIICYDEQRNSFFVPCGHCATCYECAHRIVDRENKLCPVCRRLIHKVRRLFTC